MSGHLLKQMLDLSQSGCCLALCLASCLSFLQHTCCVRAPMGFPVGAVVVGLSGHISWLLRGRPYTAPRIQACLMPQVMRVQPH